MTNENWCYSFDEEYFEGECATREAAIEEALDQLDGKEVFWIGKSHPYTPHVNAYNLIDEMADEAFNVAGDIAETYLSDVSKSDLKVLQERLNTLIDEWTTEFNYKPTFYRVVDVETIVVQKEANDADEGTD